MDSMRSLKGSLPSTSSSRRQASQPPEQLLQSFKQAALAVTTLYKTAASDQAKAYDEGYQDALEDLLGFLDKENLGLQDGEGWGVRKWATERYQGLGTQSHLSGDSDEEQEEEKRARSSSPILEAKPSIDESIAVPSLAVTDITTRSESAPPVSVPSQESTRKAMMNYNLPTSEFSFRSTHEPPSIVDMDIEPSEGTSPTSGRTGLPTVQVSLIQRPHRTSSLHSHRTRTISRQPSSTSSSLGAGAGSKRRQPLGDFFDISGTPGRDGFNGGKRGRYS